MAENFQLIDLETDFAFEFPYFPEQIDLNHASNWEPQDTTIGKRPLFYANREPVAISVRDIILDNTETDASLKDTLDTLGLFQEELADGRPPSPLLAVWGDHSIRCVLIEINEEQIMFNAAGDCTRAKIGLELLEIQEYGEAVSVKDAGVDNEDVQPG